MYQGCIHQRQKGGGAHLITVKDVSQLWFFWSRSVEDPNEYVLVEAFKDPDAGGAHVKSAHFEQATKDLPQYLLETPKIVSQEVDADDWSELGEMSVE